MPVPKHSRLDTIGNVDDELRNIRALAAAVARETFVLKELEISRSMAEFAQKQAVIAKEFSLSDALKSLRVHQEPIDLSAALGGLNAHDILTRASIGPVADLRKFDLLASTNYLEQIGISQKMLADFNARFYIPRAEEIARLANLSSVSEAAKALAVLAEPTLSVQPGCCPPICSRSLAPRS
jgi:hypothetical protein